MKISILSTSDIHGGAARASKRLVDALNANTSNEITYLVKEKETSSNTIIELKEKNKSYKNIETLVQKYYINKNRTSMSNTLFSFSFNDTNIDILNTYDIINLHWVERFITINNLKELINLKKPIVWTLHDMKPFTGGCHYSNDCEEFKTECLNCPQLKNDNKKLSNVTFLAKQKILKNSNITIISPSVWLAQEAKQSALFKDFNIEVIANCIDSSIFTPTNKQKAKEKLGLKKDTLVLTFGVMNHDEKRKGFSELIEAINIVKNKLKDKNLLALFFGSNSSADFPIPLKNLGVINDDEHLALIYSAADIFILPSLEDNLPNTILESLSCQTPIVSFDTGGAKDIINNTNGRIVPKGDTKALAKEILFLINNQELREAMGKEGRKLILNKYQAVNQANSYNKVFDKLYKEDFSYSTTDININNDFDSLISYISKNYSSELNSSFEFSKNFNIFYKQVILLKEENLKLVVYGKGTIGKTIQTILGNKLIGFVDISSKNNHPENLKTLEYDKIIISVLGREDEIIKYLTQELDININKIITFKL